jgi:2-polyprenyl-6-methoxyphenol hydroxylase-like FAD-dependent oxidoreductase
LQHEVIQFVANFSKLPASLDQTVGDMFARRTTAGMTDLDEGMVEHWYSGRMVLVGDACHKMTPNAGLGFNNGVQDAVVLCNNLRNLLKDSPMSTPAPFGTRLSRHCAKAAKLARLVMMTSVSFFSRANSTSSRSQKRNDFHSLHSDTGLGQLGLLPSRPLDLTISVHATSVSASHVSWIQYRTGCLLLTRKGSVFRKHGLVQYCW